MAKEWKYDVRFCKCGRIHMIPADKVEAAVKDGKSLMYICGGCGKARVIGADAEPDWEDPNKTVYNMYSCDVQVDDNAILSINSQDFSEEASHKPYTEILYSEGLKVPMMTGMYATDFTFGKFYDHWYPDFYKIQRRDVTVDMVMSFIDEYNKNRTTVNMDRFIRETPEEYLDYISGYVIEGFNWKGTKWDYRN